MRRMTLLITFTLIGGCSLLARQELDERFGAPDPTRFDLPAGPAGGFS